MGNINVAAKWDEYVDKKEQVVEASDITHDAITRVKELHEHFQNSSISTQIEMAQEFDRTAMKYMEEDPQTTLVMNNAMSNKRFENSNIDKTTKSDLANLQRIKKIFETYPSGENSDVKAIEEMAYAVPMREEAKINSIIEKDKNFNKQENPDRKMAA